MSSGYYHATRGRLRVRVPNLRSQIDKARSLELLMMSEPGVTHVRANSVTSNVLVVFEEQTTFHGAIIEALARLGHMPLICERAEDPEAEAACDLVMALGRELAVKALKQALTGSSVAILLDLL